MKAAPVNNCLWLPCGKGMRSLTFAVFVFIAVFLSGCTSISLHSAERPRPVDIDPKLKKVAIFTFDNLTLRKEAGMIVSDIYVAELFNSGKYRVEEPGNVRQFAIQERLNRLGEMELNAIKTLGKRLKVDAVLVGMVKEYDDGYDSLPTVTVSARLVDSNTGRIVWSSEKKRRGDDYTIVFDFGTVRTSSMLAKKVVKEMIASMNW